MKTVMLLHGTGGSDEDYFWFADTKHYLESKGYEVWWPLLPHTDKPNLEETRNFIEDNLPAIDENAIIIGHSSACPVIISFLQWLKIEIKQTILVAGFYESLNDDGFSDLMLEKDYNWEAIKRAAGEIVLINSDNDPWGCNDQQARPAAIKLGAILVVATGQGHMGSAAYHQPFQEFTLLKQLLKV